MVRRRHALENDPDSCTNTLAFPNPQDVADASNMQGNREEPEPARWVNRSLSYLAV
jgi:hypothetical protein